MSSDRNRNSAMPYISKHDPSKPMKEKVNETPQQLSMDLQTSDLEQYSLIDALDNETLWPALYYPNSDPFKESGSDKPAHERKGK